MPVEIVNIVVEFLTKPSYYFCRACHRALNYIDQIYTHEAGDTDIWMACVSFVLLF